ncbi:phosphotransferase family protein [Micromonospora sp. CPCC 206061]|uniref:phosphotransferase family protein n=1 Tax=Micromonospora sp. CPCC 206061 TaxID=3122410 RepID=UPI002FF3E169
MTGFVQVHTPRWLSYFVQSGFAEAEPLASGVEGAVYRLGNGVVAKVWGRRREPELLLAQRFYADVAAAGLPFATPVILRVEEIGQTAITYERELHGTPLQHRMNDAHPALDASTLSCLLQVVKALATVPATPAMRQLPVLGEDRPLWADGDDFPTALTALLRRRTARYGELLARHVPDFFLRYERLLQKLDAIDRIPTTVVHGDLFGENILVDDHGRPTAVLDFGFLSTAGDPRMDASITALITDMYGPHGPARVDALTHEFATELGYPLDVILLYQAAYAIATSNAFTDDGTDGHFAWCVAQLNRPDLNGAIDE